MRRQKAIVAASGPRTPINGPASSRIGVLRNGGDSGIFTAAGRLCPLRPLEGEAVEAGKNQKNSSGPSGRGHRHSSRQRLRHAFFPLTAASGPCAPGEYPRLRLAGGDIIPFAPALSPHAITAGRSEERTSPLGPARAPESHVAG
jgi:hypothetical protein